MSNRKKDITNYDGATPTVFKKLDPNDYKVNPFEANKTFTFTSASAVEDGFTPLQGIYRGKLADIGSSTTETYALNVDDSYQFLTYYSIDHLFYKYKFQPYNTFGPTNLSKIEKNLYQTCSVFSIPQKRFGDGIKKDSFTWTDNSTLNLVSDRHGNILDANANTSSFTEDPPMFYEGFNTYFDEFKIPYESHNLNIQPGVVTIDGQKPIGLSGKFTESDKNYFQSEIEGFYDRDHDYTISFWIKPTIPTLTTGLVIAKSETPANQRYPFKIEMISDSNTNQFGEPGTVKVKFSAQSSENHVAEVTSKGLRNTKWNFVVCQKVGHKLRISINGAAFGPGETSFNFLKSTQTSTSGSNYINNTDKISVGGYGLNDLTLDNYLSVDGLDELRIYDYELSDAEVAAMWDGRIESKIPQFLQTAVVGNVFGQTGFIVISTLDYRYHDLINISNYKASYKSTVRIYEHSMNLTIDEGDFTVSTNPSALKDDNISVKSFTTGSDFAPYITEIGLYNDKGQMLMIGKLANPIQNRTDIDLNIRMKIDLDRGKGSK